MKRLVAIIAALTMFVCLLPQGLSAKADIEKNLLLGQSGSGNYVYSDGKYTVDTPTGEEFEPASEIKGAKGYYDGNDEYHPLSDISLYFKTVISISLISQVHTIPSVIVAEDEVSKTYVQQRHNGALYILTDYTDGRSQGVRLFTGISLSVGTSYTLEIRYSAGKLAVDINGSGIFANEDVEGLPVIKFCTFEGKGGYGDLVLTTATDVKKFVKEFADPAEGNENVLDIPGIENKVSTADISVSRNNFKINAFLNSNFILSNDYLSSLRFYRTDIKEYSDGNDLDYVIEATLEFGDYPDAIQPWYGFGIIIGETDKGYVVVRAMNNGNIFLHDANKANGDTLYNVSKQFGSFKASAGSKVKIKIYYADGKLTVFIGDVVALKNYEIAMSLKLGFHAQNNKGTVNDFSLKFLQPVAAAEVQPKSAETAKFEFTRGKINSGKADKYLSGDISAFGVNLNNEEEYFVMQSTGASSKLLYKMTGLESFTEINQSELSTVLKFTLDKFSTENGGYADVVIKHNAQGYKRLFMRIYKDGKAELYEGTSTALGKIAETAAETTDGSEITIISSDGFVSVKINGHYAFKNVATGGYDNAAGFGGKDCSYEIRGLSYKYVDDVKFEKPEKETFVKPDHSGDANTEYIEPELPERKPTADKRGCKSEVSTSIIIVAAVLFAGAAAALAIISLKSKKN